MATRKNAAFKDNFIREVNVNYRKTKDELLRIKRAEDIATFVRSVLVDNSREHLVVLYLDGSHQVACYSIVSIGTANFAPVNPREVFQRAVLVGAVAIILAHNHPSGSILPSDDDHKATKAIAEAGKILGIRLLDHVIVSDSHHTSFSESGYI